MTAFLNHIQAGSLSIWNHPLKPFLCPRNHLLTPWPVGVFSIFGRFTTCTLTWGQHRSLCFSLSFTCAPTTSQLGAKLCEGARSQHGEVRWDAVEGQDLDVPCGGQNSEVASSDPSCVCMMHYDYVSFDNKREIIQVNWPIYMNSFKAENFFQKRKV